MPTGYTADIAKGITFEQYALGCARAFGALVMMRDDPSDAPIPERFEPSSYNKDGAIKAELEIARLEKLTPSEADMAAAESMREQVAAYRRRLEEKTDLRNKYNEILAKAVQFKSPTPDHEQYRQFMIDQIRSSIEFDCGTDYLEKPAMMSGPQWLAAALVKARHDLEYHTAEQAKEVERTETRNKWVSDLRAALTTTT